MCEGVNSNHKAYTRWKSAGRLRSTQEPDLNPSHSSYSKSAGPHHCFSDPIGADHSHSQIPEEQWTLWYQKT